MSGTEFMVGGLCAQTDPEVFHPEQGSSPRAAKRICQNCDVRSQCLEYALAHDERFGVWGGLSARERGRLHRAQQRPSSAAQHRDGQAEAARSMHAAGRSKSDIARVLRNRRHDPQRLPRRGRIPAVNLAEQAA
jgi:WhiB family redox-sensing transcriptional regulator